MVSFSFQKEPRKGQVILSVKVKNSTVQNIGLRNINSFTFVQETSVGKDVVFRDTFDLSMGYYALHIGSEQTNVFLKPGFDLNVQVDANAFDETIKYGGRGADENNYLAQKVLLKEHYAQRLSYYHLVTLSEKELIGLVDTVSKAYLNLLGKYTNLDQEFVFLESTSLSYDKELLYSMYKGAKRNLSQTEDFKLSDSFPVLFSKVNVTNDKLLVIPNYRLYVEAYIYSVLSEKLSKTKKPDYILEYVHEAKRLVPSMKIKEELFYRIGFFSLEYAGNLDSVYLQIKPFIKNEKYLKAVTANYEKLCKIKKGNPSPTFSFKDINGNTVTLEQLKGKLVYIDIWATWCGPCIKEFPSLKKLEQLFEG